MSEPSDQEMESPERPNPEEYTFDLNATLASVVSLRSQIPEDALTASVLGTERAGHGVIIADDGLVVTIGYLITEAESLWITTNAGVTVPGHVVGYDQETGFALVQALQPMGSPSMALGDSGAIEVSDELITAGYGGLDQAIKTILIAKREFAGYWEYVLDEALFTAPPHPNWGGAALIGEDGELLGIGSLLVQQTGEGGQQSGANMIIPINLLKPVLDDLRMYGKRNGATRPTPSLRASPDPATAGTHRAGRRPRPVPRHAATSEACGSTAHPAARDHAIDASTTRAAPGSEQRHRARSETRTSMTTTTDGAGSCAPTTPTRHRPSAPQCHRR